MRSLQRVCALSMAIVTVACSSNATLVVQVRTDLAPERDFTAAVTSLVSLVDGSEWSARLAAESTRTWNEGVRVAEISDLPPGDYRAEVSLVEADVRVVSRPVRVTIDAGTHVVTVLLTRDCADVSCPERDPSSVACLGGRCVPEGCSEDQPELCDPSACDMISCVDPPAPCASAACTPSGTCFISARHTDCADDEICDPMVGCRPVAPASCIDGVAGATDGLLALYTFDEGGGTTVYDVSGVAPIMDLELVGAPSTVAWVSDGLQLLGGQLVATPEDSQALGEAMVAANAFTVELWLRTDDTMQTGPATIVSYGRSSGDRGFVVGESFDLLVYVGRTSATTPDGQSHAVGTCDQTDLDRTFLDTASRQLAFGFYYQPDMMLSVKMYMTRGIFAERVHTADACVGVVSATLDPWTPSSFRFSIGSDVDGSLPWRGVIHHMAIYERAVSRDELIAHRNACDGTF